MGKMANRPTNQPSDIPALKVDTKSADGKITNRRTNQPADVPLMKVDTKSGDGGKTNRLTAQPSDITLFKFDIEYRISRREKDSSISWFSLLKIKKQPMENYKPTDRSTT